MEDMEDNEEKEEDEDEKEEKEKKEEKEEKEEEEELEEEVFKKVERLEGEDSVLKGQKYKIPTIVDDEGETWHSFKVTRDKDHPSKGIRVLTVTEDEEDIPVLSSDEREEVEGVFFRPVGADFPLEFRNESGQDLQVVIGSKFGFQLVELPSGERQELSLIANPRGRHTFGLAPAGSSGQIKAKLFGLGHYAREQGEVIRINPGLTAHLVTEDQGDLDVKEVEQEKLFRESDNERLENLFDWVDQ